MLEDDLHSTWITGACQWCQMPFPRQLLSVASHWEDSLNLPDSHSALDGKHRIESNASSIWPATTYGNCTGVSSYMTATFSPSGAPLFFIHVPYKKQEYNNSSFPLPRNALTKKTQPPQSLPTQRQRSTGTKTVGSLVSISFMYCYGPFSLKARSFPMTAKKKI